MKTLRVCKVGLWMFLAVAGSAGAQTTAPTPPPPTPQQQMRAYMEFVKTHYAKHEYRIAMRDGVKLYTQVYTPIAGTFEDKGPYPFLMTRTPYSCGSYDNDTIQPRVTGNETMVRSGYILVCQDVRGRWESEGSWLEMTPPKDGKGIDESTDTYDTVDWLLKNVLGNNGNVGIQGISYPGFYTAASIIDGHPAIKAASPQAPMINLFDGDDSYHGGTFMLAANHSFYAPFFKPQKNPLKEEPKNNFTFNIKDMLRLLPQPRHAWRTPTPPKAGTNPLCIMTRSSTTPTIPTGFGAQYGAPHAWREGGCDARRRLVRRRRPRRAGEGLPRHRQAKPGCRRRHAGRRAVGAWRLVAGYRRSAGRHPVRRSPPPRSSQTTIEAPFFAHYLKGADWTPLPKAYTFETGSNVWKKYDAWPPKQAVAKTIYFQPNGGLAFSAPTEKASKDEYVSDPAHPVPYLGYFVAEEDVPQRYMDDDQRFATTRPDVLVYQTEPLTEDVTIVGPVKPHAEDCVDGHGCGLST